MKTYKLTIAYDGTAYHGWQEQPNLPTIEGLLKQRLQQIFHKEVPFTGASRTDAGVHALGQVARCQLDIAISQNQLHRILNHAMPPGISIRSVEQVSPEFHPRVGVAEKTYYYHFFIQPPNPFVARYGLYVKDLDLEVFKAALEVFKGTHDFRSFCTGDQGRTTVRTITSIGLHYYKRYGVYQVRIQGPSFLHHMIRRMVGACFDVATSELTQQEAVGRVSEALTSTDPEHRLFVAPPEGLMLHGIRYADQGPISSNENS